ncbi:MAG: hypothetical protein IJ593_10790 [Lachnospiraceae bacterium]|nr:hypothetical protein [Lachnospiraceae bacterium]
MKRNDLDVLGHSGYRSCARKKRFKTEKEAKQKAKDYEMQYYYCDICKGYHLTKKRDF